MTGQNKSTVELGVYTLNLGGETIELSCTPDAVFKLNRLYGDLVNLAAKVQGVDFEAFVNIVHAAKTSGLEGADKNEIATRILQYGLVEFRDHLDTFIALILTGGSKPDARGEKKPTGKL